MIHLSSYHSNGLPTVVWNNKVNLIGEKVYKPKIHFCEYCDKPILVYGRLIPCKHVFCLTCATSCLVHSPPYVNSNINSPKIKRLDQSPVLNNKNSPQDQDINNIRNHNDPTNHNNPKEYSFIDTSGQSRLLKDPKSTKNLETNKSDSNQSGSIKDGSNRDESSMIIDDSTSNTTLNNSHLENTTYSPRNANSGITNDRNQQSNGVRGCHRCGNRALRVERNTLNSIYVCQIETCKRTYLSAKDLQAHINHRHNRNKSSNNHGPTSASLQAISSSPYISSSSLLHLNKGNHSSDNNSYKNSTNNNTHLKNNNNNNNDHANNEPNDRKSPNYNQMQIYNHRRDRDGQRNSTHMQNASDIRKGGDKSIDRRIESRERFRDREREVIQRERDRERNSKEYHRQSMQRAAQWAEASAQMLEKGLSK